MGLVEVLAAVAAGVPQQHYGFHRSETLSYLYIWKWESSFACNPQLLFVVDCVIPVTPGNSIQPLTPSPHCLLVTRDYPKKWLAIALSKPGFWLIEQVWLFFLLLHST